MHLQMAYHTMLGELAPNGTSEIQIFTTSVQHSQDWTLQGSAVKVTWSSSLGKVLVCCLSRGSCFETVDRGWHH